jgi:signal peptidase II
LFRRQRFEGLQLFVIAAIVVALDQWSKSFVLRRLYLDPRSLGENTKVLIPGWLNLTPVANFHGAFGMFGGNPIFLIAMAFAVLLLFWFSFRDQARRSLLVRIAFGMILGGAIGNIVDRLRYHYVVDFIDFNRFPRVWYYTFNVADACITVGVVLLILASLATRRRA